MSYQYKVGGRIVTLDVDPAAIAVRFDDRLTLDDRAAVSRASGAGPFARRFEVPNEKLTIVPVVATPPAAAEGPGVLAALNNEQSVDQALPVFRLNGNQIVASDRVIVGFNDLSEAEALAERHGLRPLRTRDDVITYEAPPGSSVFDLVAALDEQPAVRFAEPDLITVGRHMPRQAAPNDGPMLSAPPVPRQYAMTLTKAVDAWEIQAGSPGIKIAILDEGTDIGHPDLAPRIVGTFDTINDNSNQDPNAWDGHGTACAGLAAAYASDADGVRGVAGGCAIMTARIAYSAYSGGPWISTSEGIARAIHWCWTQGADVLSNSWGGGAPSNDISEQIEKARTLGRGGRGCVVVIATGNYHTAVSYPATLPYVLSVAASNQYDEAKTPTSMDGETWWGTNFGPEVDVAAPGVQNLTTDIRGPGGYSANDYYDIFNGTSSATPLVAGACALVLSANPALSEADVRAIIGGTADKVGSQPYAAGRNDYFGQGRLNVLAAVQQARARAGSGATGPGVAGS